MDCFTAMTAKLVGRHKMAALDGGTVRIVEDVSMKQPNILNQPLKFIFFHYNVLFLIPSELFYPTQSSTFLRAASPLNQGPRTVAGTTRPSSFQCKTLQAIKK